MRYQVTGDDGASVEVEAFDWMMAMVHAIERLGIEVSGWVCETRADGSVHVTDPASGRSWLVERASDAAARPTESLSGPTVAPRVAAADDLAASTAPPPPPVAAPPPLSTPSPSAAPAAPSGQAVPAGSRPTTGPDATPSPAPLRPAGPPRRGEPRVRPRRERPATSQPPGDLAERLFDLSIELSDATDGNDACRKALDLCLQLVPCEAGSVLRGGLNQAELTFVAVAGPASQQLLGRTLPFGRGIVGASFDLGITIEVDDAQDDPRHVSDFDEETGFRTRAVLCVPVQGRDQYHGAVQLLNPSDGAFAPWQRDAVEQLAASLASTLDGVAS